MVRLNLSSDYISKYKETTTFVENAEKLLNARRKKYLIWGINKELYLKESKSSREMFREIYKKRKK